MVAVVVVVGVVNWNTCMNCGELNDRTLDRMCGACILAVIEAVDAGTVVDQALARRRAWVEMRREVES